jgi:hypothetical protein
VSLGGIGVALALTALLLAWSAMRLIRTGRGIAAGGAGLLALGIGAAAGLCLGLAMAFATVDRLADETDLGTVALDQLDPGVFLATLDLAEDGPRHYRLAGDHWQLDVRFLRWRLPARLLGADSMYQLDRISGRYAEPSEMAHAELTAFSLSDAPGRLMWRVAAQAGRRLPWIDAEYGSSVYLPMADGARYTVAVTDSGLVARPDNPAARAATASW